jgi:predicted molibdopterin-dependent oxidoreductase YjgC
VTTSSSKRCWAWPRDGSRRRTSPCSFASTSSQFEEISWDEAFDLVARRLGEIRERHGADAIGFYWGNPTGNNDGALLMRRHWPA